MKTTQSRRHRLAVALAAAAALALASPCYAYDLYRGVQADANTHAIKWTADSFGVSGKTPNLSFFHFKSDEKARQKRPDQCFVKIHLKKTGEKPKPNDEDYVGSAEIKYESKKEDKGQPLPWKIVFDNTEKGHWSISRAEITTVETNNPASRVAAAAFKLMAATEDSGVTIIHGSLKGCKH